MSYKWGTCPQEIQDFVFESISEMIAIMDRTPIGVYLHGSLAMGGFNPNNSDIDLIIVTAQPLSNQQKWKLVHFFVGAIQPAISTRNQLTYPFANRELELPDTLRFSFQ